MTLYMAGYKLYQVRRLEGRMRPENKAAMILDVLEQNAHLEQHWTMAQIAKLTGYSRSSSYKKLLDQMVDDGQLRMMGIKHRTGLTDIKHLYMLPEYYVEHEDSDNERRIF